MPIRAVTGSPCHQVSGVALARHHRGDEPAECIDHRKHWQHRFLTEFDHDLGYGKHGPQRIPALVDARASRPDQRAGTPGDRSNPLPLQVVRFGPADALGDHRRRHLRICVHNADLRLHNVSHPLRRSSEVPGCARRNYPDGSIDVEVSGHAASDDHDPAHLSVSGEH